MIRFFDITISLILLILLLPILILICIILSLSGEKEVFYLQKRVGKDLKIFSIIKFATMKKNSPFIGTKTITLKNDPRILPLGNFLRKTKINEIPQLLNVLNGQMSLIGPRPLTKEVFRMYPKKISKIISSVKPGVSGLGSLVFKNEFLLLQKNKYIKKIYEDKISVYKGKIEYWYVKNFNLFCYIKILILTFFVMLFNKPKLVFIFFSKLPNPPLELKKVLNL
jgi:lipopolysaccharide/colanic/teichoic acid biosynthesis glycosyltransferase